MRSTTSSKLRNKARTLTFGLEKDAKFIYERKEADILSYCQVCECFFASSIDMEAYERVGCCRACEDNFAELNLEKWKNGWRPSKEDVILKKKERNSLLFARYVNAEK
jgi:hypothetical protein